MDFTDLLMVPEAISTVTRPLSKKKNLFIHRVTYMVRHRYFYSAGNTLDNQDHSEQAISSTISSSNLQSCVQVSIKHAGRIYTPLPLLEPSPVNSAYQPQSAFILRCFFQDNTIVSSETT